jgi:hypothetical protein
LLLANFAVWSTWIDFAVKNKHKSMDNENEGEELENNMTAMKEQPPENQEYG